jgi:transposase
MAEALGGQRRGRQSGGQRARAGGLPALRHRPLPGTPRREPLARLPAWLRRGPETYGFRGQVWTRQRVVVVRRVALGVVYYPHVGRLLNALRWSPQKPVRRARQRDDAAIARWRAEAPPPSHPGVPHERRGATPSRGAPAGVGSGVEP